MSLLAFWREEKKAVSSSRSAGGVAAADPEWRKGPKGAYQRLIGVNLTELEGIGGVYVIWHKGVKPAWVHVGASANLAKSLANAQDNTDINYYERNGGLYVAWSPIAEESRDGVVLYLRDLLNPLVPAAQAGEAIDESADPFPVKLPS